jgi:anti-sigma B factor antagonist
MTLSADLERRGDAAIVRLEGELDIATEASAATELERAMDGAGTLIADLRGLKFLDSTGVRVLIAADLRAREHGVRFGVVVARDDGMVPRLLEMTRLQERFPVVGDLDELL